MALFLTKIDGFCRILTLNLGNCFFMEKITLTSEKREQKKHEAEKLRKQGFVPAVVYGHGIEPVLIKLPVIPFTKIYEKAGQSSIITLKFGDDERNVIIQDVQYHPVTGQFQHVDFHQIRMDEKITAEIEVILEGAAPAVKEQGGILVNNIDKIEIECLPGDLIHDIKVSIGGLKNLKDAIHVKDVVFPDGIEVKTPLEEVLVFIDAPRSEAELEEVNTEIKEDVESVEGIKKEEPKEAEEAEEAEDTKKEEKAE